MSERMNGIINKARIKELEGHYNVHLNCLHNDQTIHVTLPLSIL